MADAAGGGMSLSQPSKRFIPLERSRQGLMPMVHKPGGRVAGSEAATDETAQLQKVAEDFEAVFLFQVLKQMRSTIHKEGMFHGGMGEDVFTEMMDEEFAKRIASRQTTGIAEALFKQLSRQYGIQKSETPDGGLPLPGASQAAGALQRVLRGAQLEMKAAEGAAVRPEF